ncbi:type II toxin-antitoxin system VapC family toxin [Pandoraea sp. XY-2]|uniref:type II toxin-antitoxin system VapC family toxin n=1 Tax=Pandoraea sp. XY-2 TaxID=2518599 RepID=UPI00101AFDE2|nr:type II toxin-antitoxin system VapC family toxin [Pandoraea sp. XY-2]QBC31026.1 VapC toxin family PIN domain ribonuclease [Pandoraea sp. XY-2]
MILVDTSVWIDHLRAGDATLVRLLETGRVLAHPYVIGELALGSLKNRDVVVSTLGDLPRVTVATDDEVLRFIGEQTLFGLGIGYVDAHLLAATRLTPGATIWTRDKRLAATVERLSLAAKILH